MAVDDLVIDLHHVEKRYGKRVHALRGISMQVHKGEVFGLLGPNGAGKSTLVKIITSVISATTAEGTVLGFPIGDKPTLKRVGYLPEHARFPQYLTGRQVIDFMGAMTDVPKEKRAARTEELLETVGMTDAADRKIRTYSKGMQQRIGLAQAMVNDPDLIILDEPTDGVDPMGRRDIRAVLDQLRNEGKTVFVNSHLLSELEVICDRVAILKQGEVVSQGTIDDLTIDQHFYQIDVVIRGHEQAADDVSKALGIRWSKADNRGATTDGPLRKGLLEDGTWIDLRGGTLRVGATEADLVQPVIDALRASKLIIKQIRPVRPSLEDLFFATVDPNAQARAQGGPAAKGGALNLREGN